MPSLPRCGRRVAVGAVALLCSCCLALSARTGGAARASVNPNVIGADLLIRNAKICDIVGAWRFLNSSAFKDIYLVQVGSEGETPVKAAVRAGCAELVAMIMLHPGFNDKTLRKKRLRKELVHYVVDRWDNGSSKTDIGWALDVVDGVLAGKVARKDLEWDPKLVIEEWVWFVPAPGEWLRPMTFSDMGLERRAPDWNLTGFVSDVDERFATAYDAERNPVRLQDFDKLWYLLVSWLQADPGDEELPNRLTSYIRSIGWSLFFWGGQDALLSHLTLVAQVAQHQKLNFPPDDAPEHRGMLEDGVNISKAYFKMGDLLARLWNMTGSWVIFDTEEGLVY